MKNLVLISILMAGTLSLAKEDNSSLTSVYDMRDIRRIKPSFLDECLKKHSRTECLMLMSQKEKDKKDSTAEIQYAELRPATSAQ